MNEQPPSYGEGGPATPANDDPAARDDAAADSAPARDSDGHARFRQDEHGAADARPESEPFPWPPAHGESPITAFGRTWRDVMFTPASFFRRMPAEAPLGPALAYFLVVSVLGSGIRLFWDMLALLLLPPAAEGSVWSFFVPTSARDALISFFFAPVVLLCILFIGSAVTHALLKLVGGASRRFGATARVFAYVQSASLLVIAPVVGAFVAAIWSFVIAVVGLREAHRTTTAKALFALLLPVFAILFLFFMLLVVVIMGAAVLSA